MGKRSGSNPNNTSVIACKVRKAAKKRKKDKKEKKPRRPTRSETDKLLSNFEALCVDVNQTVRLGEPEESVSDPGPSTSSSSRPRRRSKRVKLKKKAESELCSLLGSLSCDTTPPSNGEGSPVQGAASFLPAIHPRDVRLDPRVRARLREELPVDIVPREQLLDKEQRKKQKKVLKKAKKKWKKSRNEDRRQKIELRPSVLNVN